MDQAKTIRKQVGVGRREITISAVMIKTKTKQKTYNTEHCYKTASLGTEIF